MASIMRFSGDRERRHPIPIFGPGSLIKTIRSGLVQPRDVMALTALLWRFRAYGTAKQSRTR